MPGCSIILERDGNKSLREQVIEIAAELNQVVVPIYLIRHFTDKAICVSLSIPPANQADREAKGITWLPKSQITVYERGPDVFALIPDWLASKKRAEIT